MSQSSKDTLLMINVVEQIEYYFGDFNMVKDKFLRQEVTKDDGWIPITTLLRFNRLAALTKDVDFVLKSFAENPSNLVLVDEDRKAIRRNPERPLPEHNDAWRSDVTSRSIYVKGFPVETTTFDDILKFMQTFGKIDNVFKRSYYDKALKEWKFKGSIFVAFPSVDDAEKFMSIKSVKFGGNELIRKWQSDYIRDKKNERIELKLKAKESKNQLLKEQQEGLKDSLKTLPTGALLSISGLDQKISLNALKTYLTSSLEWDVAFIDYQMGETTGYVRLQEQNTAKEALSKLADNSFEFKGLTVKVEIVEGENETEILKKMETEKNSKLLQNFMKIKGNRKGKGKKFRNGKNEKRSIPNNDKDTNEENTNVNDVIEENIVKADGDSEVFTENPGQSGDAGLKRKANGSCIDDAKKLKPDEE